MAQIAYFDFSLKVTWIRHKDHKVLIAGGERFTDDQRFQLSHRKDDKDDSIEDMVLIIKYCTVS